jgi:hypothetical protein
MPKCKFLVHVIIEGMGRMPKKFTLFLSIFLATLFGFGPSGNNAGEQTSIAQDFTLTLAPT